MIRQPTPFSDLYRWHRGEIRGLMQARHDGEPQCGWYRMRLVKGGPWVPVEIKCEREIDIETGELASDERLVAIVERSQRRNPLGIWLSVRPISREAYDALMWERAHDPKMLAVAAKLDLSAEAVRP